MSERAIFKANRVANADLTGWLEDHAVVVEGDRIASVEDPDGNVVGLSQRR